MRLWRLTSEASRLATCDLIETELKQFRILVKVDDHVLVIETFPDRTQALDCASTVHDDLTERGWAPVA
jgi:hypothetical protein